MTVPVRPSTGNLTAASTGPTGTTGTVGAMRLPFRSRRQAEAAPELAPSVSPAPSTATTDSYLPVVRTERALVALAVHAQQIDLRLTQVERRLDVRDAEGDDKLLDLATQDDLLEVRMHSARVSAELTRVAVELQARIDDLAVQMPTIVAEDKRLQRARTLAETIIDLSDQWDTNPLDLREGPGDWAATA
jgi:hypothetical protein